VKEVECRPLSDALSRETLLTRCFRLERADGVVIAACIGFMEDGFLVGNLQRNLVTWDIDQGHLALRWIDGSVAAVFYRCEKTVDRRLRIDGSLPDATDRCSLALIEIDHGGSSYLRQPAEPLAYAVNSLLPGVELNLPACLIHTNIPQFDWDLGNHLLQNIYVSRIGRAPDVTLQQLPGDARLIVPNWQEAIAICGRQIVAEQIHPDWSDRDVQNAVASCRAEISIDERAVIVQRWGMRTWGHWLGELLPRIKCLEAARPGRYAYALPEDLLDDIYLRSTLQSLEYYGITRDRFVFLRPGYRYRFAELLAVSSVWSPGRPTIHPGAVELMREVPGGRSDFAAGERVALLRREWSTRRLENLPEVEAFLRADGWQIVDIALLPFDQQVRVFSGSTAIVSILGSGLAGLIYSPANVNVITLAPVGWADDFFFGIMQNRNARLADVRGIKSISDPRDAFYSSFRVDVADLGAAIAALGLSG
jgi:hypothetical protein